MSGTTVFQGNASLDAKQFLDALKQLQNESKKAAAEIRKAFKDVEKGVQEVAQAKSKSAGNKDWIREFVSAEQFKAAAENEISTRKQTTRLIGDAQWEAYQARIKNERKGQDELVKSTKAAATASANEEIQHRKQIRETVSGLQWDLHQKNVKDAKQRADEEIAQAKASQRLIGDLQWEDYQKGVKAEEQVRRDRQRTQQAAARQQRAAEQRAEREARAIQNRIARDKAARERERARLTGGRGGGRGTRSGGSSGSSGNGPLGRWWGALKSAEDQFNSVFRAGRQIGELGFIFGAPAAALTAIGVKLTQTGQDFDLWIRKSYAAAQAAGSVGVGLDKFGDVANRVSQAVGAFNPTETAQSLYYWQSALGTTIEKAEDLRNTELALQAVSMAGAMANIDQATAIRGVANVLQEFGLNAIRATDVTAKLFNASQISAVEFPELLQSFRMLGPLANAVGMPLEEVLAILTGLADVGSRGTAAGRGVNQILTSMIKPSKEAAEAMDQVFKSAFGKTHEQVFFQKDANGLQQFIGLLDKLDDKGNVTARGALYYLSEATKNLTEEEKKRFLATLTSQNGMRAILPLLDDYEKSQGRINARLKEFNSGELQIDRFADAWETVGQAVKIGIGQQLNRVLEALNQIGVVVGKTVLPYLKIVGDGAQTFVQWARAHEQLLGLVVMLGAAFAALGAVLGSAAFLVGQYIQAFSVLQTIGRALIPIMLAVGGSWVGVFALLAAVLASAIMGLQAFRTNLLGIRDAATQVSSFFRVAITAMIQSLGSLIAMVDAFIRGDWARAWDLALDIVANIGVLVQHALSELGPAILSVLGAALAAVGSYLDSIIPGFSTWGSNLVQSFAQGMLNGLAFVVNAALSIIGVLAGFFESHSPPKEGPLRFIDTWGMNLMNTYLAGMKKADFRIVNEVASLIEKELDAQMRDGRLSPGEYFVKNMQARQILTGVAYDVRGDVSAGKPINFDLIREHFDELRDTVGITDQFAQSIMESYANIAPVEALLEKDRERLDILKEQKGELSAQLDVLKQTYDLETFDQNEQLRKLRLRLDIKKQEDRLEELGLPTAASGKKGDAARASNRSVRAQNKAEELDLERQIEKLRLDLMHKQEVYEDKAGPRKKQEAEKSLEMAKLNSEIGKNERLIKPWMDRLEASKQALDFEEKIYATAKKAADEVNRANSGGGGGGGFHPGAGDGGAAINAAREKYLKAEEEKTKGYVQRLYDRLQTGLKNAIKPFTEFNASVAEEKEAFKEKVDAWLWKAESFAVGLSSVLQGKAPPRGKSGMRILSSPLEHEGYSEHGEMAEKTVQYLNTYREYNYPEFMQGEETTGKALTIVNGVRNLAGSIKSAIDEGLGSLQDLFSRKIDETDWGALGYKLGKEKLGALLNAALDTLDLAEGAGGEAGGGLVAKISQLLQKLDWYAIGKAAAAGVVGLILGLGDAIIDAAIKHPLDFLLFLSFFIGAPEGLSLKVAEYLAKIPIVGKILAWLGKELISLGGPLRESADTNIIKPLVEGIAFKLDELGLKGLFKGLLSADDAKTAIFKAAATLWGLDIVLGLIKGVEDKVDDWKTSFSSWVETNIISYFKNLLGIKSPSTVFAGFGENIVDGLKQGVQNKSEPWGVDWTAWLQTNIIDKTKELLKPDTFSVIGGDIANGLWSGISAKGPWLKKQVHDWVTTNIPESVRNKLGIQSPSLVMKEIGGYVVDGLAQGLGDDAKLKNLSGRAAHLGQAVKSGVEQGLNSADGASSRMDIWSATDKLPKRSQGPTAVDVSRMTQESLAKAADVMVKASGKDKSADADDKKKKADEISAVLIPALNEALDIFGKDLGGLLRSLTDHLVVAIEAAATMIVDAVWGRREADGKRKGSRHSGGPIDSTGSYFLDRGEYVLNRHDVGRALSTMDSFRNINYRMEQQLLRPSLSVGGQLNINVNVAGSGANAIDQGAKDEIIAATAQAITRVLARR